MFKIILVFVELVQFLADSGKSFSESHFQIGRSGWSRAVVGCRDRFCNGRFIIHNILRRHKDDGLDLMVMVNVVRPHKALPRDDSCRTAGFMVTASPELHSVAIEMELENVLVEGGFHAAKFRRHQFQRVRNARQKSINVGEKRLRGLLH